MNIVYRFNLIAIALLISILSNAQNSPFKRVKPCTFGVDLPVEMKINKMYNDYSPDFCDYEVKLNDGNVIIELHSLLNSRSEFNTITELYYKALKSSKLRITYKMVASDYFVISGINNENGNIVYWKRVLGQSFVSDLNIEYNQSRKSAIEKYIARISKSFTSD